MSTADTATRIGAAQDPEGDELFELHILFGRHRCVWKGDRRLWVFSRWGEDGYPENAPVDVLHWEEDGFNGREMTIDGIRKLFYSWLTAQEGGK